MFIETGFRMMISNSGAKVTVTGLTTKLAYTLCAFKSYSQISIFSPLSAFFGLIQTLFLFFLQIFI